MRPVLDRAPIHVLFYHTAAGRQFYVTYSSYRRAALQAERSRVVEVSQPPRCRTQLLNMADAASW